MVRERNKRERERRKEGVEGRDKEVFGQGGDEGVRRWVDCTMGSLARVLAMKHSEERPKNGARQEGMREKASLYLSSSNWPQWPITSLKFYFFLKYGCELPILRLIKHGKALFYPSFN